jgi:DNA polymerase III delta prime subunit
MEQLNFIEILNRNECKEKMKTALKEFQDNKTDKLQKRGIYIYGAPGSGKTMFAEQILREEGYDVVKYDAGDIRNKGVIENITMHTMSDKSVISLFHKKVRPIAILMDEIDGMNNGDKGGINALIKLIRPKKTKKQKLEDVTCNPIICVSNYHVDKKIKELMKVCTTVELKTPKNDHIRTLVSTLMPELQEETVNCIIKYLCGDLRKLNAVYQIYTSNDAILTKSVLDDIFRPKTLNEDTKDITKRLLNNKLSIDHHGITLNETDRTIVGLLWHENIVDPLSKVPNETAFPIYRQALQSICFSDYIDRITFQKQIWQFNEMSSLIKTFKTNKLYHESLSKVPKYSNGEVRFTKVLTKYSTEYNNAVFIQNLCQQLGMDKKDTFSFFLQLRNLHNEEEIYEMFESYDICKLDINRVYRYLDKYTKRTDPDADYDSD